LKLIEENGLEDDLTLGSNGNKLKLTKITANERTYYTNIENLKRQLEGSLSEGKIVVVFEDLPAINSGLRGVIIKINENNINDGEELSNIMKNFQPGDEIKIVTKDEDDVLEYSIVLGEDPNQPGRAVIGIGLLNGDGRLLGQITDFFNFSKKVGTNYEPRFNADFVLFIYNLIWWLALINLSVALINMWPVAIFDGGRFFMLSVWAITGSEKFAMKAFKIVTYLILGSLALLMLGWFVAIF